MSPRVMLSLLFLIFLNFPNISHSLFDFPVERFLPYIHKDKTTNLYYITLPLGYKVINGKPLPPLELKLAIDLGGSGPILVPCATAAKSSSYNPIKCSPKNTTSKQKYSTCRKFITSSFTDHPVNARLIQDTVFFPYTTSGGYLWADSKDSYATLTCTEDVTALGTTLDGSALNGSIGLAKSPLSLLSQFVSMYKFDNKIAICLPSKIGKDEDFGNIYIGDGLYIFPPLGGYVNMIFVSTPLITNPKSTDYFIDVKSIEIRGKVVPFDRSLLSLNKNGYGGTKISTLVPYTLLHSSIYKGLVAAYVGVSKMVKAPPVKPFGTCFMSRVRPGVPVIDLVLNGGGKWKIYGSNSLVKVSKDVVCLGFVDGGLSMKNSMVIGGFQMEDNLVEFDLKANKFSVSSSLLVHNTSCAIHRSFV